MALKIGLGRQKGSKAVTVLIYILSAVLASNLVAFLSAWVYSIEEIDIFYFIVSTILGIIFGVVLSVLKFRSDGKIANVERFWESILQSSANGVIFTDLTGKIKYANSYALNFHGYTIDELKEFYIFDLVTLDFIEVIREYIKDIVENKAQEVLEIGFLAKGGAVKYAQLSGQLVKYGSLRLIQFVEVDITEKRRFEDELIEAERKYRELFENAVIGVYRSTPDGRIIDVNPAFVKMFGAKDKHEIMQRNASELYPNPEDRLRFVQTLEVFDSVSNFESKLKRFDGKEIYVREHVRAVKDSVGNVLYYEGMIEDITEQKEAEEKLKLYAEQLEVANAQLQELNKLKSEFLANTSHELRTPLNSIIGFLNLIKDGLYENHEEMMKFVNNALTSARHLLNIINDILDIAKIEAGKLELNIEDVEVSELLNEVWTLSHVQAEQKKLEYKVIYSGRQVFVKGDRNRLKQILLNLIGNSIKFTHKGGITVKAEVFDDKGFCQFTISDTGIGISRDKQVKLFQKFVQADGTTTRKYGGTGLGLAITKSLVELMGGTIELYSEGEGKGTTVTFTIPLSEISYGEEVELEQGKIYGEVGLLILVVDDDARFADFLKNLLIKNSFRFVWSNDAENGWNYILNLRPDILILDYAMPHKASAVIKNGFDLFLKIYDMPELRDTPIIILTGHPQKISELLKLSFININPNILEKPVDPGHLLNLLNQFVKNKDRVHILLADDDANVELYFRKILPPQYKIDYVKNGREAIEKVKSFNYDVLLLDLMMPEVNGYDVIEELRLNKLAPELPIIVVTNYPEPATPEERELLSRGMGIIVIDKSELNLEPEKLINLINAQVKIKKS